MLVVKEYHMEEVTPDGVETYHNHSTHYTMIHDGVTGHVSALDSVSMSFFSKKFQPITNATWHIRPTKFNLCRSNPQVVTVLFLHGYVFLQQCNKKLKIKLLPYLWGHTVHSLQSTNHAFVARGFD